MEFETPVDWIKGSVKNLYYDNRYLKMTQGYNSQNAVSITKMSMLVFAVKSFGFSLGSKIVLDLVLLNKEIKKSKSDYGYYIY